MGKKLREYKRGDFIFAKVKGYPAWPARVRGVKGKKYYVYFYGTGETANLTANVLFDYEENKEKFTKTVKRKFFNEGVQQIDYDFVNKVPLEDDAAEQASTSEPMDESGAADTTADETADETMADTSVADTTAADESTAASQNNTAVEDSDEGPLVIDEGKKSKKDKKKPEAATPKTKDKAEKEKPEKVDKPEKGDKLEKGEKSEKPEKEPATPKEREPRTPRAQRKDSAAVEEKKEKEKDKEEVVSRSGRKIRPKRYIDEVADETPATPSASKKRRAASPAPTSAAADKPSSDKDKNVKYNVVSQDTLQGLAEPLNEGKIIGTFLIILFIYCIWTFAH